MEERTGYEIMEIRGKKVKKIKSDGVNDCGLKCCFYNGKDCLNEEKLICCDEMGVGYHFVEVEEEGMTCEKAFRMAKTHKADEGIKPILKNSHYENNGVDVIDLMKVSGDINGFLAGNVLKYVARRNNKGQHEDDIVKAMDYMIMLALEEGMEANKIAEILEKRKMRNTK